MKSVFDAAAGFMRGFIVITAVGFQFHAGVVIGIEQFDKVVGRIHLGYAKSGNDRRGQEDQETRQEGLLRDRLHVNLSFLLRMSGHNPWR
jgi:hypothetical protein